MHHPTKIVIFQCPYEEAAGNSRQLLYRAAKRYLGRAVLPHELSLGPHGKPYFPALPQVHFSITHSGQWWLCAFSGQPLGLDVQLHRSYAQPAALSRRFFHPEEDAFLAGRGYQDFFDLWCAKESYVKYTGQGFFLDPGDFCVVREGRAFPVVAGVWLRLLPFLPGYSLCLCAHQPSAVTFFPMDD